MEIFVYSLMAIQLLIPAILIVNSLRKVNLFANGLTDNAVSFTNVTDKLLNIRKAILTMVTTGTLVAADSWTCSLDEVPVSQMRITDSRSHIIGGTVKVGDVGNLGTGKFARTISFNRGDLELDTDEALFLNLTDIAGAPTVDGSVNLFYEA